MDNPKTKAIRGTRHRTMTNETKKNVEYNIVDHQSSSFDFQ